MRKSFIAAALALAALAACSRENPGAENRGGEIRFTSNIENAYAVKGLDPLAAGKQVRIIAGAPVNGSVNANVEGTALNPVTPLHWAVGQTESTTFVGIYPTHDETSATISEFAVANDGVQDFEYMNNFLAAVASAAPGTTVNLPFRHPLVKVVVDIDNQLSGAPAVSAVTFKEVLVKGDIDLENGTVANTVSGIVYSTKNTASGKFEAIILPQTSARPVLTVNVGEKVYNFRISYGVNFEAGKSYTATLTLKDSTPEVGEAVGFSFSVSDWDEVATPIETTDITASLTVYAVNSQGWAQVYFYGWQVGSWTALCGAWPGSLMTETVTIGANLYNKLQIEGLQAGENGVLVNAGDGLPQTVDIPLTLVPGDNELYIRVLGTTDGSGHHEVNTQATPFAD